MHDHTCGSTVPVCTPYESSTCVLPRKNTNPNTQRKRETHTHTHTHEITSLRVIPMISLADANEGTTHSALGTHTVMELTDGMELNDVRISASNPSLFFQLVSEEPALLSVEFQEYGHASRCMLLASPFVKQPTVETAVWRLASPESTKTLTIHPADDNCLSGAPLYLCVRFLEDSGSTFFRLKLTVRPRFTGVWLRRTRCAIPASVAPTTATIMRRAQPNADGRLTTWTDTGRAADPALALSSTVLSEAAPARDATEFDNDAAQGSGHHGGPQMTCSSLYLGEWRGACHDGLGVCFYSVADEAKLIEQQETLLRATYERRSIPWSAHTIPEDQFVPVDADLIGNLTGLSSLDICRGWDLIPTVRDIEVYSGSWVSGRKEGRGVYQWADRAYVGSWFAGRREGEGRLEKEDGSWYKGMWHKDHRHGPGEALLLPARTIYHGQWRHGFRHGRGTLRYPSGVVLDGEWSNNELLGDVRATFPDGAVYHGSWLHDQRHGHGVLTHTDGTVQENEWHHDAPIGAGTIRHPNGVVFRGTWVTGENRREGVYTFPNGDTYEGGWDFARHCRHGHGRCTFTNGDVYDGEWHHGLREGDGCQRSADGQVAYDGQWHADQRHGHGTLREGPHTYTGAFEAGQRAGFGEQRDGDGSHYSGYWRNDHRAGKGTYYSAAEDTTYEGIFLQDRLQSVGVAKHEGSKERYAGSWLDGHKQGHGTHTLPSGDVIRGVWFRGVQQDGSVEYMAVDGSKYVGEWCNGQRAGRGTQVALDGTVYEGQWRDGQRNGNGRITRLNGETVECEWRGDAPVDGPGEATFLDGSVYRGELAHGVPHGEGALTYPDDTVFRGRFRDGLYEL